MPAASRGPRGISWTSSWAKSPGAPQGSRRLKGQPRPWRKAETHQGRLQACESGESSQVQGARRGRGLRLEAALRLASQRGRRGVVPPPAGRLPRGAAFKGAARE